MLCGYKMENKALDHGLGVSVTGLFFYQGSFGHALKGVGGGIIEIERKMFWKV